jgi:ankyrin repeat protein
MRSPSMQSIDEEIEAVVKKLKKLLAKERLTADEVAACQKMHLVIQKLDKIKRFLDANGFTHVNHVIGRRTPLLDAIFQNDQEMFDLLLRHPKINVNQTNDVGQTAVWTSASHGKLPFLQRLARTKADFRKPDTGGVTPFFAALKNKFYEAGAFILHKLTGFSIYEDKQFGQHPVHALTTSHKSQAELDEIFTLLKNNHADLNIRNDNMETPLMVAARFRNTNAIKALIDNGADVTLVDRDGNTFLETLKKRNREEVLNYMAVKGMNANWYEDVKTVKEYGHVLGIGTFLQLGKKLGLGGVINVPLGQANKPAPVYTESWHRKDSYRVLQNELEKHIEKRNLKNSDFNAVHEAVVLANRIINGDTRNQAIEESYVAYQANKPVILPVTLPGHGVGLAIYKDKLIFTDRFLPSGKKINDCTKIFQLNNRSEAAIRDLLNTFSKDSDADILMAKLQQYVDFDHPLLETGDKLQMHGTCSYSNPRSNIEGILCAMSADRLNRSVGESKIAARRDYRDLLYSGRFRKAQQLMTQLNEAENAGQSARANMFYDLAESYIRGHRSRTKNNGTDRENALEIYQRLPPRLKHKFNSRNPAMAGKLHRSLLYTKVRKLLPKSKRPITHTLLQEILHQIKIQENLGKSPNLSEAILNTYQLAISSGQKNALKETHHLVKLFALDNSLPEIDFEHIFNNAKKPLLTDYQSQPSKQEKVTEAVKTLVTKFETKVDPKVTHIGAHRKQKPVK